MRIERISVSNYSRLQDLSVEIRRHAVVVGTNDVGKTSLIRLLQFVVGSTQGQIYQGIEVGDLRDPEKKMVVSVTFTAFTDAERTLFPNEITISSSDQTESLLLCLEVETDSDDPDNVIISRYFPESGHTRSPTREQLVAFGWRYLPATRGSHASQLDGPSSALQVLLQALDLGTEKAELVGFLNSFNDKLDASERISTMRTDVAAHLSKAMPKVIKEADLSIRTANDPAESVLGNVSMFFERSGEHIPITEQSDGLRQLMSMTLFDLAQGTANVIAIDEPELHLHPSSQRTVAELFTGQQNQKILATHSPYIVQRFEPSQVIAISPSGKCSQVSSRKLTAIEKLQSHWWSPRLLEALTARFVIVVEGVADRIIVDAAARAMGIGLDRLGAVVFELDGANKFPHVYKMLGPDGFDISTYSLVDENEQGVFVNAIGGRPKDVLNKRVWVSKKDLEDEYCRALTGPVAARALVQHGVCREDAVTSSCGVQDVSDIEAEDLAAFCRKNKVTAATAIGATLDSSSALAITSVSGLLGHLGSLGEV
ncbi:ATP-dependent nuclease [Streptomyces sp. NPDC051554]|uniref:ATP-dependent nuclease n=1 Tax=Streptomyces sp. NPDC051554 TaxID=3365656 RepID=UPI003791765A